MFGVRVGVVVVVGERGSSPSCNVKLGEMRLCLRCSSRLVYGAISIMHGINSQFKLFYISARNARTGRAWKWNSPG